jgi:hypothetical protein
MRALIYIETKITKSENLDIRNIEFLRIPKYWSVRLLLGNKLNNCVCSLFGDFCSVC